MITATTKPEQRLRGDILAQAFLKKLVQIERAKAGQREKPDIGVTDHDDPVEQLAAATDGTCGVPHAPIRADLAAVAVLVARAIEAEAGFLRRLRREAPVATIATQVRDMVELVREVVERCVFPRKTIVLELNPSIASNLKHGRAALLVRDGTARTHTSDVGNDVIATALHARVPLIGIAPDPSRELPRDLNRAAEAKLVLPPFDSSALALVIEAVVGGRPMRELDEAVVRMIDVGDLPVALRRVRTPDQALKAVSRVLVDKTIGLREGVFLRDLHGYGAAREWGLALAQDIGSYRAGEISWSEVDSRGLLLTGPPGVGKTSFARALAKECAVPLIATSVAEWNSAEYLSGVLRRIREAFATARSRAPCILFVDELDGIADKASLRGEYVQYWSQIVNCFLELLSGIEALEGVVVVAATNFPNRIDPAIRRAGRLDREIAIERPNFATLVAIFRQYTEGHLPAGTSLVSLALAARGSTGADIEAWVRRAQGAVRRAGRTLGVDDILAEIRVGRPPLPDAVRRRIAVHEAGHVVTQAAYSCGSVVEVSLHDGGGTTWFENAIAGDATVERVEAALAMLLAGRVAEEIAFGSPSIGAGYGESSDLGMATSLARDLELRFGMGSIGLAQIDSSPGEILLVHGLLDAVSGRLRKAELRVREVLQTNWGAVEAVAAALEQHGYLSGADISAILAAAEGITPGSRDADASTVALDLNSKAEGSDNTPMATGAAHDDPHDSMPEGLAQRDETRRRADP